MATVFQALCIYAQDVSLTIYPTCPEVAEGVIVATVVSQDFGNFFTFRLSNAQGVISQQTDDDEVTFDGLFPGSYCLKVFTNDGCSAESCDVVVEAGPVINNITPICICPGSYSYGGISVEASGGSGVYSYTWSGPPGTVSNPTVPNPSVFATGTYAVTVTDIQTGCEAAGQTTVINCDVDLADLVQVLPDCNAQGTSSINVQLPTGYGLAPFEFKWVKLGQGLIETDGSTNGFASLENASPGEYCLSLLTMNGCSEYVCGIIVGQQFPPEFDYEVTPPDGGANGAIDLEVLPGQLGPFSYMWSNGATTASLNNLSAGNYCVTVTDGETGCTGTACVPLKTCDDLNQAIDVLEADVTAITVDNNGNGTGGAIHITNVQDQFPGYDFTFNWSNGAQTEDIEGLPAGMYHVSVASGDCPDAATTGSWEVCGFKLSFGQFNTNCFSTALKAVPTPLGNYKYKWDTGETTQSISSAAIGSEHCVTVTALVFVNGAWLDGCSVSACYTPEFKSLGIELLALQPSVYGNANGSIQVNAIGGKPPFQYYWSNGMSGATISGLVPGFYTVTVTDACGKQISSTYYIQCEFGQNDLVGMVTDVACGTNGMGSISLTQLPNPGGVPVPHFAFKWSNGETSQNISGLSEGEYCVTVTEVSTGCYVTKCFTVGNSGTSNFTVSFESTPGCYPLSEGSITAVVQNSNPANPNPGPFSYAWGTWYWGTDPPVFGNTPTLTNVPAGWYGVVVTDAMGCTASNMTLMWPPPPAFNVSPVLPTGAPVTAPIYVCPGQTTAVQLTVTGAIPQSFSWANYSQYPLTPINTSIGALSNLSPGSWGVTVTDVQGCQAFATFSVQLAISEVSGTIVPDCVEGSSIILTPKKFGPYTYLWSNGATTKDLSGLTGAGTYCVTVTNSYGCTSSKCFQVESAFSLRLYQSATVLNDNCSNSCIGSIDLAVEQSPPATYLWSNGETSQDIDGLCAGQYSVTITSSQCEETYYFGIENGLNSCGLIGTGLPVENGSSIDYVFPNMILQAKKVNCFDNTCNNWPWGDHVCSELVVKPILPPDNCWTGTVEVRVFQHGNYIALISFEVVPNGNGFFTANWLTSDESWEPSEPGTYDIEIGYYSPTGTCETDFQIDWYGPGNYNDAVGFNGDFWFDWDYYPFVPEAFREAYFGAWRCQACKPENLYIMNNDQDGGCNSQQNWDFTFFNFYPSSYEGNPCNNEGTMDVMDFDANGEAMIMTVPITAPAIESISGLQPFSNAGDVGIHCNKSGWCLFEAVDVYGTTNPAINKPILATWSDQDSCIPVVFDEPNIPNPSPCSDTEPCPEPLVCDEASGNCYQPCSNNDDCMSGVCDEDGYCVEANICQPDCPLGYECYEGECYLEEGICGFSVEVSGQGGENTYTFYNDGSLLYPGAELELFYNTYHIPDNIQVYGDGVETPVQTGCIATSEPPTNPPPNPLKFNIGYGNTINVKVNTCGSTSSKFKFNISCSEVLQNDAPAEKIKGQMVNNGDSGRISIRPNPFTTELELILPTVEADFVGQLMILDKLGREVVKMEAIFTAGYNSIKLEGLEKLMDGLYIVLVSQDGRLYGHQKAVKSK